MVFRIQGKGGRWAAVVRLPATADFLPPPIFSPWVSYGEAHHSAANAVSERNLLRKGYKITIIAVVKELVKKTTLVRFLAQSGGIFAALKKNEKVTDRDNQVRLWQEIFICM